MQKKKRKRKEIAWKVGIASRSGGTQASCFFYSCFIFKAQIRKNNSSVFEMKQVHHKSQKRISLSFTPKEGDTKTKQESEDKKCCHRHRYHRRERRRLREHERERNEEDKEGEQSFREFLLLLCLLLLRVLRRTKTTTASSPPPPPQKQNKNTTTTRGVSTPHPTLPIFILQFNPSHRHFLLLSFFCLHTP